MAENEQLTTQQETAAPQVDLDTAKKTYSRAELNIALFGIIDIVLVLIGTVIVNVTMEEAPLTVSMLLSFGCLYLVAFPIYLLLSKGMRKDPPKQEVSLSPGMIILMFFTSIGLMLVGNLIGNILNIIMTTLFGVQTADTTLQEMIFSDSGMIMALIAVIGAPIVEEIVFRKILIDRIRRYGEKTAILISGIFFGLFHGNFSQFFYAAFLGIFFACIYMRTGKVIYTIILHCMVNFWGSFVPLLTLRNLDSSLMDSLLSGDTSTLLTELPNHIGELLPFLLCNVFLTYLMAISGIIMLFAVFLQKMHLEPTEEEVPAGQRFKTACLNLGCVLLLIVCVGQFVVSIAGNITG